MKLLKIISMILILFFLTCCTAGPNQLTNTSDASQQIAGFWSGLWHGFILLFSFIFSLFSDITIYEVHNNGTWYNFGYLLGIMVFFGGSGGGAGNKACKH